MDGAVTPEKRGDDLNAHSGGQVAEDWERCAQILQQHSDEMVQRWKSEIDMHLIFAGLFSAVLTSFNVQSYQLLQPDEQAEVVTTLKIISSQLNGYTFSPPFINSTVAASPNDSSFNAPRSAIWLNSLWFSALIVALSTSSVAIVVRQWLHQYSSGLSGTSRETAQLRQYRYESLMKWRVSTILTMLPVLLQLALVLFLAGLLILLWTLHPSVALVASVLVGSLFLFNIISTIIPAFRSDCCYQSPQSLCFFVIVQYIGGFLRRLLEFVNHAVHDIAVWHPGAIHSTCWTIMGYIRRVVQGMGTWGMFNTWEIREKHKTHTLSANLDFNLLQKAYEITLDDNLLETTIARCMKDLDPLAAVQGCVVFLHENTTSEELFRSVELEADISADVRFVQGRRRARYQSFLFSQTLAILPACAESASLFSDRARKARTEVTARKFIALLPPRVDERGGRAMAMSTDPAFESAMILRALSKLVRCGIASADAFLKLLANISLFESESSTGLRQFELNDIAEVIDALPIRPEQVAKSFDWQCNDLAGYYFAAVTALIHVLLDIRLCSSLALPDDARIETLLRHILSSIEAVLSHRSWSTKVDWQRRVMAAICLPENQWEITRYLPFLPTLLQLSRSPIYARFITPRLVQTLRHSSEVFHQSLLSGTPHNALLEDHYHVLTQAVAVLETSCLSREGTDEVALERRREESSRSVTSQAQLRPPLASSESSIHPLADSATSSLHAFGSHAAFVLPQQQVTPTVAYPHPSQ